jgi:hypothetical protein
MALDAANTHLLYEVLGVPHAESILYLDGAYATGATLPFGAIKTTVEQIDAILVGLPAALEDRLVELLAEWKEVATETTEIKPNAANQGVSVKPARKRGRIRLLVRAIVPVVIAGIDTPDGLPLG